MNSVCVFIFLKNQILTRRQLLILQSCSQKRAVHLDRCVWSGQSRPRHQPFTPECFTLSVFIRIQSHLRAQNHIHDQTWPDPIKLIPPNTSAMPQQWEQNRRRRRNPFSVRSPDGQDVSRTDETSQTSRQICEERAVCSRFGLKPQDLDFTAKSLSRTDVTSAG